MNTQKEAREDLFERMKADRLMDNLLERDVIAIHHSLEKGSNHVIGEVVEDNNVFIIEAEVEYYPETYEIRDIDGYPFKDVKTEGYYEVKDVFSAILSTLYDTYNFDESELDKIKNKLAIHY